MFIQILSIIAPVAASAGVGYVWARMRRPYDATLVTRLIMNIGAPFLILSSFQNLQVEMAVIARIGLAAASVTALTVAVALIVLRVCRFDTRTYLPPIIFQNTGNMGLPICLFAFGDEGLALAIVVMVWVFSLNFSVGVAITSGRRDLKSFARTPLVWATLISVGLLLAGIRLPEWILDTAGILGDLTIPLMLITLGVSLASLRVSTLGRSVFVASLRFALGFSAGLLVVHLLGLTGAARGVVLLQSTMPPAVLNYLMAARYDRNATEVAGVVVVGTLMSAAILPAVLWFVLWGATP